MMSGGDGVGYGVTVKKSKAQMMMEQMGWQGGSGLGKYEQGIVNPLIA